jgi:hypothetical protein
MLRSMYEKVLRAATRTEDLTRFLNGSTLRDVWRDLFLPPGMCDALGKTAILFCGGYSSAD